MKRDSIYDIYLDIKEDAVELSGSLSGISDVLLCDGEVFKFIHTNPLILQLK